jgi:hexokinase
MGIKNPSLVDCANIRYICECVSKRSAYLVSAGLAVLLNKMDEKSVTIGVDGSVYRYHPFFHQLMVEKIKSLTKSDIKVSVQDYYYAVILNDLFNVYYNELVTH